MLRRVAVAVLTLVCVAPAMFAQTADDIIAKNIEAHGGAAKLKAIKSIKITAKIEVGPGMEAPAVMYESRPHNVRREFTFQGMTAVMAYDGKDGWQIMPFQGKKDAELMPADDRDDIADDADLDGQLMDYAAKGNKVEFLGKDKLDGTDVYKLKVTLKDGAVQTYYIDTDSNLEVRVDTERMVRGTPHKTQTVIGDYKEVDGLPMPFSFEGSDADHPDQKQKITVDKIEINPAMTSVSFAMPPPSAATTKGADTTEPKPTTPDQKPADTPKSDTPKQ